MITTPNEHILIEAQLYEVTDAENELNSFVEEKDILHVKLSKRSWDILMAAVGYMKENKEMDGDWDD